MKKTLSILSGIAIVLLFGIITAMHQVKDSTFSDLTLANIECLGMLGPDLPPVVRIPCKHTGNKDDLCIYTIQNADGTVFSQSEPYCINDPDHIF